MSYCSLCISGFQSFFLIKMCIKAHLSGSIKQSTYELTFEQQLWEPLNQVDNMSLQPKKLQTLFLFYKSFQHQYISVQHIFSHSRKQTTTDTIIFLSYQLVSRFFWLLHTFLCLWVGNWASTRQYPSLWQPGLKGGLQARRSSFHVDLPHISCINTKAL